MEENVLRKDYLLERWIILTPGRAKRPVEQRILASKLAARKADCVFCPGNESRTPPETIRLGSGKNWRVRVFDNKFAICAPKFVHAQKPSAGLEEFPATGFHELLVDTPFHNQSVWDFSQKQMLLVLDALCARQSELKAKKGVKHVYIMKNWGVQGGASLAHSHWQIVAFPTEPTLIQMEKKAAKEFFRKSKKNAFDWIVKTEKKSGRKWLENREWMVFCPFASVWPYEFWIMPKKKAANFAELTPSQKKGLASIVLKAFSRLKRVFGNPAYNLVFHESMRPSRDYRFHIEVYPNIDKIWAGIEKGAGIFINEVSSETAAKTLRRG